MKISLLKSESDYNKFKIWEHLGFDVYRVKDLEQIDLKIDELIKQNYSTIIISNEVASFSEKIIKKYNKMQNINIIITPK